MSGGSTGSGLIWQVSPHPLSSQIVLDEYFEVSGHMSVAVFSLAIISMGVPRGATNLKVR